MCDLREKRMKNWEIAGQRKQKSIKEIIGELNRTGIMQRRILADLNRSSL